MITGFWVAMGFLTRLPIPPTPYNDEAVKASLCWYPLVGLILGGWVAFSGWGLTQVFSASPLLAGVLSVAVWVGLTGALHLDGLADTLDAWVGGLGDRERTLAIMKDPHVGSTAVVWLGLFLFAKVAAVTVLVFSQAGLAGLALGCAAARLTPLWLFHTTPYVRAQGLGSAMQNALGISTLSALTLTVIGFCVILLSWSTTLWLMGAIVLLFSACRYWMLHRLGGTTGDTAGALIELTELGFILTLVATFP